MPEIAADVPWPDADAAAAARAAADPRLGAVVGAMEWLAGTGSALARPRLLVLGSLTDPVAALAAQAGCPAAEVVQAGYQDGLQVADAAVDEGADVLLLAVPAADEPGVTESAAVLASVLTGTEPAKVLARGAAAADAQAWMRRAVTVRDRRRRLVGLRHEPGALLDALADATLATAVGVVLQAAARRTPVVLDGAGTTAAAALAFEAQPRAVRWWAAADAGTDPGQQRVLALTGISALLHLGVDTGDGTAALLALHLLRAACLQAHPAGQP